MLEWLNVTPQGFCKPRQRREFWNRLQEIVRFCILSMGSVLPWSLIPLACSSIIAIEITIDNIDFRDAE